MNNNILLALGLMLILEGLLPFIAPQIWRETFRRMVALKDGQLRFVGMVSLLGGLVVILLSQ